MDQHRQLAISIGETQDVSLASANSSQSSTASACVGTTHSLSNPDNSFQPASKRANYSGQSSHTLTGASNQQHANPIDDAIHSKRIGKL